MVFGTQCGMTTVHDFTLLFVLPSSFWIALPFAVMMQTWTTIAAALNKPSLKSD